MSPAVPEVNHKRSRQTEGPPERSSEGPTGSTPEREGNSLPRQILRRLPIILAVGVFISVGFSFLAVDRSVFGRLAGGSPRYFALAILLALIPWLTNTLRLMIWTRFLRNPLSFLESWRIALGTEVAAAATPTIVGGGPVKVALLVQRKFQPGEAVMLTTLSSLEDAIFFAIAVPSAILWASRGGLPGFEPSFGILHRFLLPLVIAMVCLGFGWIMWRLVRKRNDGSGSRTEGASRFARVRERIRETIAQAKEAYILIGRRGKRRLILSLSLVLVQWSARYTIVAALAAGFGVLIDPVRCFATQWLVYTLLAAVPSPGATGGAEAGFYLLFGTWMPADILGIVTVAWRFVSFHLLVGSGAIIFALLEHSSMRKGRPSVANLLDRKTVRGEV